MTRKYLAAFAILALLVISCGPTKYTQADSTADYGFIEIPVDDDTYRISFRGNVRTDLETVDRYALYRAVELTESKGYDYFVVAENTMGGTTVGSTTTSKTLGTSGSTGTEHTASKSMKLYKGTKPPDLANAYDARSVIRNMQPYIER